METKVNGKIILFGEHLVVYPEFTGIFCPVGFSMNFNIKESDGIRIISDQFEQGFDIAEIKKHYKSGKEIHIQFLQNKNIDILKEFISDKFSLLKFAIGVAINYLDNNNIELTNFTITGNSSIPQMSGFGSSAAMAVGIIKSILTFHNIDFDDELIFELAMEVEQIQHGTPSGGDVKAVIYNEFISFTRNKDKTLSTSVVQLKNKSLNLAMNNLRIIYSGRPEVSTAETVSHVRLQYESDEASINKIFAKIEQNTQKFLNLSKDPEAIVSVQNLVEIVNVAGEGLEQLGVVSDLGRELSAEIRKKGGGIKVSGGGGLGEGPCGAFVAIHEDISVLKEVCDKFGVELFEEAIG